MTELLAETDLTHTQQEYLSNIRLSAECLLTVINDILDFSKVEAGKLDMDPISFDPRSLITDVVRILGISASKKNVEITERIALTSDINVVGDAARIKQILINLVR